MILENLFSRFDGESYRRAGSSAYSHKSTYGMANYLSQALTTGCNYASDASLIEKRCSVKTELMDMNTLTWSTGPDYSLSG